MPGKRRPAWSAWSAEVFADVYGTLCCGSGFAQALMALLAEHPRQVKGEIRAPADWGSYPTRRCGCSLTVRPSWLNWACRQATSQWPTPGRPAIPTGL